MYPNIHRLEIPNRNSVSKSEFSIQLRIAFREPFPIHFAWLTHDHQASHARRYTSRFTHTQYSIVRFTPSDGVDAHTGSVSCSTRRQASLRPLTFLVEASLFLVQSSEVRSIC